MDLNVLSVYIMSVSKHDRSGILYNIIAQASFYGLRMNCQILFFNHKGCGTVSAQVFGCLSLSEDSQRCREAVRPRGGARRQRGCGGGTCFYALQLALPCQCVPQPAPASVCIPVCVSRCTYKPIALPRRVRQVEMI